MATLWSAFDESVTTRGEAPAVFWNDRWLTYRDLEQMSARVAGALAAGGIRAGDRVVVGLPNSSQLVGVLLGVLRMGAVYVPLNPAYTADEAGYIIEATGGTALVHPALRDAIARRRPDLEHRLAGDLSDAPPATPPAALDPEAPALIVFTSGTTGQPKGAILSHRALVTNLRAVTCAWEWQPADRLLLTLPCSHLHGLGLGLLGSLLAGSSVVLRARFAAEEVPGDLARFAATMFFGVPTMYNRLVQLPRHAVDREDLSGMRLWVSGSAPLLVPTYERFLQLFGHALVERFGMTEGGFMITTPLHGPRRGGVVGLPLPGIEVRIVDDEAADRGLLIDVPDGTSGELLIRGPNLFSGYWRDPTASRAAFLHGYFRSGDVAVREPDGLYRIAGRRSVDVIKTRGYKVSALEIENRLQAHPGVREVAVVGVPHDDWGEEIVAVVSSNEGRPTADALLEHARQTLATYKVPRRVVFMSEIPKIGPGKFRKHELLQMLGRDKRL